MARMKKRFSCINKKNKTNTALAIGSLLTVLLMRYYLKSTSSSGEDLKDDMWKAEARRKK